MEFSNPSLLSKAKSVRETLGVSQTVSLSSKYCDTGALESEGVNADGPATTLNASWQVYLIGLHVVCSSNALFVLGEHQMCCCNAMFCLASYERKQAPCSKTVG